MGRSDAWRSLAAANRRVEELEALREIDVGDLHDVDAVHEGDRRRPLLPDPKELRELLLLSCREPLGRRQEGVAVGHDEAFWRRRARFERVMFWLGMVLGVGGAAVLAAAMLCVSGAASAQGSPENYGFEGGLIFWKPSPEIVLTSGAHRVDTGKVAREQGLGKLHRAAPDFVRRHTGQVIGGDTTSTVVGGAAGAAAHPQMSSGDGSAVSIHRRHGSRPGASGSWK